MLKQVKHNNRTEWAIVSKSNPKKVLEYFGVNKPSREQFLKSERRVKYYKSLGSSPVRVHTHRRKGRVVKSHLRKIKKSGVIPNKDRKVFDIMSSKPFKQERGGYLDFGKNNTGSLEKFDVATGNAYEVNIPSDYEAVFHTHVPSDSKSFKVLGTPSPEDMVALAKTPKIQASVIFHKGKSYSVIKTPQSKRISRLSPSKIMKRYNIDNDKKLTNKLKHDGFIVKESKKGSKMVLPIKVVD